MKKLLTYVCLVLAFSANTFAQAPKETKPTTNDIHFNPDEQVTTSHTGTINGQKIAYTATNGTLPVWDDKGKAIAGLFFSYYQRTDVKDANRPLFISFNGGPGSASVWMQLAYTGPHMLNISDEGYPVQPYGVRENPYSILDVADIVFVNPVSTGYSRALTEEGKAEKFYGVNQDVKYLADWINGFVGRYNRWNSPKYLIGESYGTTR
jgi:carboxypeptidase C (cathepsin A)